MFQECDSTNLKFGTTSSGLCALWDEHLAYLEGRLTKECVAAGEKIYKTVNNVDGVFLNSPLMDPDNPKHSFQSNMLHEYASRVAYRYMLPQSFHLYRQVEYYDIHKKNYVMERITSIEKAKRKYTAKANIIKSESTEPQSRFEVTYKNLMKSEDHQQGLFGDLTWIKDRKTDEKLAERISFFLMLHRDTHMVDGTRLDFPGGRQKYRFRSFFACQDYAPRVTNVVEHYGKKEYYPKSAYEFVSRVLIPTPYSPDENNILYDLSVGMTKIKNPGECVGKQTLGPNITPDNLLVNRQDNDLKLSVKGEDGSLTYRFFFQGPKLKISAAFSDGLNWSEKQVLELGNLTR